MSDYLWDKKGEPDAEVARLEAALGAFRHEPRPLNLPAGDAAPGPHAAKLLPFAPRPRASRLFAPAALAAAAALLVAAVLVASAFLRAQRPAPHVMAEEVMLNFPPYASGVKDEMTPAETEVKDEKVKDEKVKDDRVTVESLPRVPRRRKDVEAASVQSRRQHRLPTAGPPAGGGLTLERMSAPDAASSFVENTRLLTKEQLVYALRLTGAKLKDVRQRAQKAEARP